MHHIITRQKSEILLLLTLFIIFQLPVNGQDGKNSALFRNPEFMIEPVWSRQIDPRWEEGAYVGNEDDGITVEFVEFSSKGDLLVTGNGLGKAFILRAENGSAVREFVYITEENIAGRTEFNISGGRMKGLEVECGAFTPDGKQVILGGNLNGIKVFDMQEGTLFKEIEVDEEVDGLGVSADGRFIGHAAPMSVQVRNLTTWDPIAKIIHGQNEGVVNSVDFTKDGSLMVSAGNYGQVLVNRTSDWELAGDGLIPDKSSIKSVRFSPDGKYIAAGYGGGYLVVFRTDDMSIVRRFRLFYIEAVAWTGDGQYLLAGGRDNLGRLRVFRTSDWALIGDPEVQADHSNIEYIDIYKDKIAIAGEDAHVRLFRIFKKN